MTGKRDAEIQETLATLWCHKLVTTHSWFVSEQAYKNLFAQADIIFLVIDPTNTDYGIYQITGTLGDALAYGNRICLPDRYAPHYDFSEGIIRYALDTVIDDITKHNQAKSIPYREKYQKEKVIYHIQQNLEKRL